MPLPKKQPGRFALCDACGELCDLDAPETHATQVDGCMPLVLCARDVRRVVWDYFEREARGG